ncbi:MAG: 3-mercaptopyruvate sulfurtransferase [Candidatus Heimdallarchaeota archaeon LC_2]|nr:MAG: 3-mercaptopyruvate sulfurtransferase [Candidatus Heimdallarchaeota archaeon LC_2]
MEFYNGKEKQAIVFSTFISASDLNNLILDETNSDLVIIDCRYFLTDPKLGYHQYKLQHIPGALFADLDNNLSGPIKNNTGRHPLPNLDIFTNWLIKNSISKTNHVVIYDQLGGGIAARLWLMLVQIGYESVRVLEGGIINWKRLDYQLESGDEIRNVLSPEIDLKLPKRWEDGLYKIYSKSDVKEKINGEFNLIDSRSPERYAGEVEPIDTIAGHIPSAKNIYWQSHLEENLLLKSLSDLKKIITEKVDLDEETVFYCGSGVTAAFNVLIMKHLELPNPGIYIGSWSEWIRD